MASHSSAASSARRDRATGVPDPVMCCATGFNTNEAGRQLSKKLQHFRPCKSTPNDDLSAASTHVPEIPIFRGPTRLSLPFHGFPPFLSLNQADGMSARRPQHHLRTFSGSCAAPPDGSQQGLPHLRFGGQVADIRAHALSFSPYRHVDEGGADKSGLHGPKKCRVSASVHHRKVIASQGSHRRRQQ